MNDYRVFTAELHARTAVHVGSGAGNDITDALIRRDAQGNSLIPGTAIAGVLRALLTRLAPRLGAQTCKALSDDENERAATCTCRVCQLMGSINPSDEQSVPEAAASRLFVFNARLRQDSVRVTIRDGVGIDRRTQAAARAGHVKFDLEVLPPGVIFDLCLELRGDIAPELEQLLAAGLAEWQAGRLWLGGRVGRGLGAFELKNLSYKIHALDDSQGLLDYLQSDHPTEIALPQPNWISDQLGKIHLQPPRDDIPNQFIARRWVKFEGILKAGGPLLTNDTTTAGVEGFDHAPLLGQMGDLDKPVLSGSGLRGVLRSHAERIARTLATNKATGKDDFLTHCPACNPLENRKDKPLANCDSLLPPDDKLPNKETSAEHLCLACRLFGSTRRGSRLIVEDALYQPTGEQPKPAFKMLDFLAIDRFTGGGADKFKFDALVLWQPAFQFRMFLDNPEPWELGWLALVLRDMQDGWLNVGMGANKGMGQVNLDDLKCTLGYLTSDNLTDLDLQPDGKRGQSLYGEMPFTLQQMAPWVSKFTDEVKEFDRSKSILPEIPADTYYGVVDHLYPVREVTE